MNLKKEISTGEKSGHLAGYKEEQTKRNRKKFSGEINYLVIIYIIPIYDFVPKY